jgi:putative protease
MPSPRAPEILAPAGDMDALRAAVAAGADAVYFGLHGFNARARATNFDEGTLRETLRYLHDRGVKGYVTLNTLVFDDELPRLEAAVRLCAEAGVDAVIVQDLGVATLVRAVAPSLPIHASTQMTCTDAASVELARSAGATRIILARELSLDDIAAIRRESDAELEVFVHGALCIAYSGQCLTSEAIGGRSANRGACAQACRLPYELVVDGVERDLGDKAYLLSPEDLETSALVPQLIELGVTSLKIEGRLKGPEYVAATTRLYRRAVDAAVQSSESSEPRTPPTHEDRRAALQMFSRGSGPGFLAGVDHQRLVDGRTCDHHGLLAGECAGLRSLRGKTLVAVRLAEPLARGDGILVEGAFGGEGEVGGRVWSIALDGADVEGAGAGDDVLVWLGPDRAIGPGLDPGGRRVWKTSDPAREKEARAWATRDTRRVEIHLRIVGKIGEPAVLEGATATGGTHRVALDAPVEEARAHATGEDVLRDKLGRLGDTPFALGELRVELPPNAMIPLSSLNRARRALVAGLLGAAPRSHATTRVTAADLLAAAAAPDRAPPPPGLFVLCRSLPQAAAALDAGADGVYLDFLELTGTGAALRELRAREGKPFVGVAPPRIRKPGEEKIDRYLAALDPDAILVRGLGALHGLGPLAPRGAGGPLRIGDFSLNVTNALTAAEVFGRGVDAFTPSFDLDAAQLGALLGAGLAPFAEIVVHHPMPLFHMEHCVIAALLSEGRDHRTCGRPCDRHKVSLRDRAGLEHPVEADVGCRNTVFHAAAQSAAHIVLGLRQQGARRFRIELVRESADDVRRIVATYRGLLEERVAPAEAWRALQALKVEGGYGVVKGSLRSLPLA